MGTCVLVISLRVSAGVQKFHSNSRSYMPLMGVLCSSLLAHSNSRSYMPLMGVLCSSLLDLLRT